MVSKQLGVRQQAFVASFIGPAKGNATEAARLAGYKYPNVQGPRLLVNVRVQEKIDAYVEKVEKSGIAHLQTRVDGYNERREQFLQIVRDRGWLAKSTKMIGGGEYSEKVEEYIFDAALARELRELEKQAAQDLGQWSEKREVTNPDGQPIQIVAMRIVQPE